VSFCAALAHSDLDGYVLRGLIAIVFSGLYLAFTVFFGSALQRWDYDAPGRCYHTHLIASSAASHPYVDRIYLIITCIYMLLALFLSIFPTLSGMPLNPLAFLPFEHIHTTGSVLSDSHSIWVKALIKERGGWPVWARKEVYRGVVLVVALLQYPLHLYSAVALRISNEDFLDGESEGEWSFGQVMALMLVADTLIKCGTAIYSELPSYPPLILI
jgi:hypothetical protein